MRRILSVSAVVLISIGVAIAWILPSGYNNYTVRSRLVDTLQAIDHGKSNLESACVVGAFALKQSVKDIGISDSDPKVHILHVEFLRVASNVVHVRFTLMDIYGQPFFLLFQRKAIPQGSILEFEYSCSAERKFSSRLIGSTVEQEYLPQRLRD
jgi:hypothetical protein